jgi:hypothetical protein
MHIMIFLPTQKAIPAQVTVVNEDFEQLQISVNPQQHPASKPFLQKFPTDSLTELIRTGLSNFTTLASLVFLCTF